jgi:hypothetical protein
VRLNSPHCEHLTSAGALSFHKLERLLSRLALEVFLLGTAIVSTSLTLISIICKLPKDFKTRVNPAGTAAAAAFVQILAAFMANPRAILPAQVFCGKVEY